MEFDNAEPQTNILGIDDLWNCENEKTWTDALAEYWFFVKPTMLEIEKEMVNLDADAVQNLSHRQWYDFLLEKFFRWKYSAANRYVTTSMSLKSYAENNQLDELYQIKQSLFVFDRSDVRKGLEIATQIKGLGTAGASGLLSILFPEHFGTVDQFAVKALRAVRNLAGEKQIGKMKPESLQIRDGVVLITIMRNKAKELNQIFKTSSWTPRKIDMVLWTFGR